MEILKRKGFTLWKHFTYQYTCKCTSLMFYALMLTDELFFFNHSYSRHGLLLHTLFVAKVGWKNNQECKNNESHTFTIKISMKIVFIGVYANNSSTVVYGGDILSFHKPHSSLGIMSNHNLRSMNKIWIILLHTATLVYQWPSSFDIHVGRINHVEILKDFPIRSLAKEIFPFLPH